MNPSKLVEEMYQSEAEFSVQEEFSKTVSINLPIKDASMLKAMSERMGKSLFNVGGEILHHAINEMLWAFTDSDKIQLAEKADQYTKADYEKKEIKSQGNWAYDSKGEWEALVRFSIEHRQKLESDKQIDIEDQIAKDQPKKKGSKS